MSHVIEIKVRGYHLDLFRHVNNARYLEFLEEARWSFLEQTDNLAILEQQGYAFAVVNININYRRAAYMGEILRIVTSMKSIGERRCVMHQAILLQDSATVIADADVTFVIVDTRLEKAIRLEGEMRKNLERMTD
ncbi:MAG TPA: thioesterase family protein [Candidatus Competibacteraceae bacterium]|nr:thioesterase family protein [Candidatus Competibacteraceae bacterium]HQA26941.1 thioesterase family protein [Candidatus Competibacteraceae bacterium]HQD56383.1 thioesterase family protein [Candidatus Competibacteraceae bacterium]